MHPSAQARRHTRKHSLSFANPPPQVKVHKAPLKSNGRSLPITPLEPTSILASFQAPLGLAPSALCNRPPPPALPSPPPSSPIPSTRAENGGCTVNLGGRGGGRCSLYAELKRRRGKQKRQGVEEVEEEGGELHPSVVFEPLIEEEVGRQVLVLLAGEVGLDDQSLRET